MNDKKWMQTGKRLFSLCAAANLWCGAAAAQEQRHPKYDYPTAARADYVIGCLMEHDFKHEVLGNCACRIDVIADAMSYDDYDRASTILGYQRNGGLGRAGELMRSTPIVKATMKAFHAAQAAADKACVGPQ